MKASPESEARLTGEVLCSLADYIVEHQFKGPNKIQRSGPITYFLQDKPYWCHCGPCVPSQGEKGGRTLGKVHR